MKRINDIFYEPANGYRGLGDLYLPDEPAGAPVALVIHGGGLITSTNEKAMCMTMAEFMVSLGYAPFGINYRLPGEAPWPASGDDCVAGAKFLLKTDHPAFEKLDRSKVVVVGATDGGFLALWTGLHLPKEKVRAIITISSSPDLVWQYETNIKKGMDRRIMGMVNPTTEQLKAASPISCIYPGAPPLLCIHSKNDTIIPSEQSAILVEKYRKAGSRADFVEFHGKGEFHGIWDNPNIKMDTAYVELVPEVTEGIRNFLKTL